MTDGPRVVDRVGDLREVLTATGAGLYLVNHVAGPLPAETMAAVRESDDLELRIGRSGPDRDDDLDQREKEARAVVAATIKAAPDDVVLVHGAAEGIRLAMLELAAGTDESGDGLILCHAGLQPRVAASVDALATAIGRSLERVESIPDVIRGDVDTVVFPHVSADGERIDIDRVGSAARAAGAHTILDASLSVGAMPLDVSSASVDIVVADAHRWLLGPEGTGLLWWSPRFRSDASDRMRATAGPFGRGDLLGVARSVGWLLMYIELPWVVTRTGELADRLYEGLAAIDGVTLATTDGSHGAVAALAIDDWTAVEAAEEMSRGVFAIVEVDVAGDRVRASVGAWNREQEIDRFLERVAELAAHTPETLPRKPALTVLSGPTDLDA